MPTNFQFTNWLKGSTKSKQGPICYCMFALNRWSWRIKF